MAPLDFLAATEPAALLPSRIQMAFTLAYHIILVPLGVAFPLLTVVMEGIGLRRNDPVALRLARRWSVVMAVQFAVGAVTGTILSFEFGILWPRMMGRFGDVFGIGFGIEGWAFFLEAIFIGIYLYGWKRLPPKVHYRLGWVLPPSGVLGAFGVIIANSWMNTPRGFQLGPDGRPMNVDVMGAIFTPAFGYEFWHLIVALYMTAGFMVASIYAVGWLRGRRDRYHRLGFTVPFTLGAALAPIQVVIGDIAARGVFLDQPAKFAAMEITWQTQSHNPEVLGGLLRDDGTVWLGLSVPSLDSLLAGFSASTVVRGLASFSPSDRPSVVDANFAHLAFDVMVGLGSIACVLTLWYAVAWIRYRDLPRSRWFFRGAALAGIGSYIGIEAGWITTEVGRQPWIVHDLMRVSDAVNPVNPLYIWIMFSALLVVYAVIAYFFVTVLIRLSARWRLDDEGRSGEEESAPEEAAPYGPRPA
ncbi:MAG: cytochrome ubiquinol oxidase subunit I [Chloroflexi bacterium 13_1_40CM_3_65_12]|nr:MAG: cytochrome ubiquinol oxidase subunit I [Chloroflexi bacterium 13_1_40CM_65_17]OLD24506.1 MAG: cytochrome ubiquinol oxidase subunit I [Chloroflexi bacterium 13_1_40CM_3_65_12]